MSEYFAAKASYKEWIGLATLALPTLIIGLDMSVLHLAVPHLSADLRPSSSQLLWIVDIYGFLIAGFLLTMGTIGDRVGRRKLLLIGAVAFIAASVLAAFSHSAEMLIFARALLGIAGATLMPSTLSLIRNMFHDPGQRTFAISIWMMSLITGQIIGPVSGGLLLEFFWWGSVFLVAIPFMAALLIVGPFFLPEYRDPSPGKLDFLSVTLSMVTILSIVYGIKEFAKSGLGVTPFLFIAIGVIFGVLFIRRERSAADPVLDVRLFRDRAFSTVVAIHFFTLFSLAGLQFIVAQHLQLVLGLSPLNAGLWKIPAAIAGIVGALLASWLVRRWLSSSVIAWNLAVAAIGFFIITQVDVSNGLVYIVVGLMIANFAISLVTSLTTDLIISSVPYHKAGSASGISETSAELGIAMGIAVLGSISTALYRIGVSETMPAGVPDFIAEAALDTLGGAVAVASDLPQDVAESMLAPAREAFAAGVSVNAAVAAVLMLIFAILANRMLRPRAIPRYVVPQPAADD